MLCKNDFKKIFVVSDYADNTVKESLRKYGQVISVKKHIRLMEAEAAHPDMQINKLESNIAVYAQETDTDVINSLSGFGITLIQGDTYLQKNYPYNIAYNVLHSDKIFFHNIKYTDSSLAYELQKKNMTAVNIKQGYAGCSGIFAEDVLITSDRGIYKAAADNGVKCIFFYEAKKIKLPGLGNGFIGGCCGYDRDIGLLINCSKEYMPESFSDELTSCGIKYLCVGSGEFVDIGGIIVFTGQR